jgi:hypothetical protein
MGSVEAVRMAAEDFNGGGMNCKLLNVGFEIDMACGGRGIALTTASSASSRFSALPREPEPVVPQFGRRPHRCVTTSTGSDGRPKSEAARWQFRSSRNGAQNFELRQYP